MEKSKVKKVKYIGKIPVLDITVDSDEHLFFANGIATSNCAAHAKAYSVYSVVQMWLQEHYFLEYMATLLTHVDRAKEKKGVSMLDERVKYCLKHGTYIYYPDVNESGKRWKIKGGGLLAPLSNIKNFGDKDVDIIENARPFNSISDFLEKTGFRQSKFEMLLFANALSSFGDVETLYNWYINEYSAPKKKNDDISFFDFGADFDVKDNREIVSFTSQELEEKCFEMNGFYIDENLLITMKDVYENPNKYIGEDALSRNEKVYSIQEALNKTEETIQEKIKQYREDNNILEKTPDAIQKQDMEEIRKEYITTKWILGKVKSINKLKSKKGNPYSKTLITDGVTSVEIMKFGDSVHNYIKPGNVVILPVNIREGNLTFADYKVEKKDIFLIER